MLLHEHDQHNGRHIQEKQRIPNPLETLLDKHECTRKLNPNNNDERNSSSRSNVHRNHKLNEHASNNKHNTSNSMVLLPSNIHSIILHKQVKQNKGRPKIWVEKTV